MVLSKGKLSLRSFPAPKGKTQKYMLICLIILFLNSLLMLMAKGPLYKY